MKKENEDEIFAVRRKHTQIQRKTAQARGNNGKGLKAKILAAFLEISRMHIKWGNQTTTTISQKFVPKRLLLQKR